MLLSGIQIRAMHLPQADAAHVLDPLLKSEGRTECRVRLVRRHVKEVSNSHEAEK